MADVTGPIASLPGSFHAVPSGLMCDDHPDRPVVRRFQGETDSFGSEMHDLCQECVDQLQTERANNIGRCDWCKTTNIAVFPTRDYEEGRSGPVYDVCIPCKEKANARMCEDLGVDLGHHTTEYDEDDYEEDFDDDLEHIQDRGD